MACSSEEKTSIICSKNDWKLLSTQNKVNYEKAENKMSININANINLNK